MILILNLSFQNADLVWTEEETWTASHHLYNTTQFSAASLMNRFLFWY